MKSNLLLLALIIFAPLLFNACGGNDDDKIPQFGNIRVLNALEDDTPVVVKTLSSCWSLGYNDAGSDLVTVPVGNQQIQFFPFEEGTSCVDYKIPVLTTHVNVTANATFHYAIAGSKETAEIFPITLAEDFEPDGIFVVKMMNLVESKQQLNIYLVAEGEAIDFTKPATQLNYGQMTESLSFELGPFKAVLTETADTSNTIIFDSGILSPYESSGVSWLILPYEGFTDHEYQVTAALYTAAGITLWTEKSRVRFMSLYTDGIGYPDVNLYVSDTMDQKECPIDPETLEPFPRCVCHIDTPQYCELDNDIDKLLIENLSYGEASEYILGEDKFWTLKFTKMENVGGEEQEQVFYERRIVTTEGDAHTFTLVTLSGEIDGETVYSPNGTFVPDEQRSYDTYGTLVITNNFFASDTVNMIVIEENEMEEENAELIIKDLDYLQVVQSVILANGNYHIRFTPGSSDDSPSEEELAASAYDITVNSNNQTVYITVDENNPEASRWILLD